MAHNPNLTPIVITTVDQLRQLVREEREAALAENRDPHSLLDRKALARRLAVSLPSVDRLCQRGCPYLKVGDVRRFSWPAVAEWLAQQP